LATFTAASPMAWRVSAGNSGAGLSSMSFWWRRWAEQSRSPTQTTLGYMMIQMELNDDTWYLVRDTTGVGDFTGAAGKPIPMRPDEVQAMLGKDEKGEDKPEAEPITKINFAVGELVKIKEGAFDGFEGTIDTIDESSGRVKVLVDIFGRSTEVELEHWQAEKL
jgi:transcriptional antiterminator NusG